MAQMMRCLDLRTNERNLVNPLQIMRCLDWCNNEKDLIKHVTDVEIYVPHWLHLALRQSAASEFHMWKDTCWKRYQWFVSENWTTINAWLFQSFRDCDVFPRHSIEWNSSGFPPFPGFLGFSSKFPGIFIILKVAFMFFWAKICNL